jgi:hypothetical protein
MRRRSVVREDIADLLGVQFERILIKALEKDRHLPYQTATDLKTALLRLRRDTDPGRKTTAEVAGPVIRRLSDRSPCCSART